MSLRRLHFVSGVLTTLASSGVVGTVLLGRHCYAIAFSFLTLCSNLVRVFAERLVLGRKVSEQDLAVAATSLRRICGHAGIIQQTLTQLVEGEFDNDEVSMLVREANRAFRELNGLLSKRLI